MRRSSCMQSALGAEQRDEAGPVVGIAAKRGVDADGGSRHSARSVRAVMPRSSRMLLQHQEGVEHRSGTPHEQFLVAHVEQLVDPLEFAVDGHRHGRPPDTGARGGSAAGSMFTCRTSLAAR